VWSFRRGTGTIVALNFSSVHQDLEVAGEILLSTAGDAVSPAADGLTLRPWEGVVVAV
jgi:hypothetical protein